MKNIPSLWFVIPALIMLTSAVVHAEAPVTTPSICQRGIVSHGDECRLAEVMVKARCGEEICVAAIGAVGAAGATE